MLQHRNWDKAKHCLSGEVFSKSTLGRQVRTDKRKRLAGLALMFVILMLLILGLSDAQADNPSDSGGTANITSMRLITPTTGWVLVKQRLLWTTTAGEEWKDITPDTEASIDAVFLRNNGTGRVVLRRTKPLPDMGVVLELASTANAGVSWSFQSFTGLDEEELNSYSGQASIDYVNELQGWLGVRFSSNANFSFGALFVTADGGTTWSRLPNPPIAGSPVRFVTPTDGWLAGGPGGGSIYVTRDGGNSWQRQSLTPPSDAYSTFQPVYELPEFVNTRDGFMKVTYLGPETSVTVAYRTYDAGLSWELSDKSFESALLPSLNTSVLCHYLRCMLH